MKTVIVTGASRGIGLACAELLLRSYNDTAVVGVGRTAPGDSEGVQQLCLEFPSRFSYVCGDITDDRIQQMSVDAALAFGDGISGVVLNAGQLEPISRICDVDLEQLRMQMEVNVISLVGLVQKTIRNLRLKRGRLVFVSSGAAVKGYSGWGGYCIGKAGMNMLVDVLGKEELDVVSVGLRPGVVDTAMQREIRKETNGAAMGEESHSRFVELERGGKLLAPDIPGKVISEMVLFAGREFSGRFVDWAEWKPTL